MIWYAPWGSHVDIGRIVSVSDPSDGMMGEPDFTITFQLLDKPTPVYFQWTNKTHKAQGESEGKDKVVLRWHSELIKAWKSWIEL